MTKINILAPINSPVEIEDFADAGADEFYCGVLSKPWKKAYTNVGCVNRREFAVSNLTSFQHLKEAVEIAHANAKPLFLTINAFYSSKQLDLVLDNVNQAIKLGIDALILADLNLISKFSSQYRNVKFHVSSGATVFNTKSVNFFRDLGASRIILPRHLTISEIKALSAEAKGIELETFIMNTKCRNVDGFCTYQHGLNEIKSPLTTSILKKLRFDYYFSRILSKAPHMTKTVLSHISCLGSTSACCLRYNIRQANGSNMHTGRLKSNLGYHLLGADCGACALFSFEEFGIKSIKIVGRENPSSKKLKDIKFLKESLNCLEKRPSRKNFILSIKDKYKKFFGQSCKESYCYYHLE